MEGKPDGSMMDNRLSHKLTWSCAPSELIGNQIKKDPSIQGKHLNKNDFHCFDKQVGQDSPVLLT